MSGLGTFAYAGPPVDGPRTPWHPDGPPTQPLFPVLPQTFTAPLAAKKIRASAKINDDGSVSLLLTCDGEVVGESTGEVVAVEVML